MATRTAAQKSNEMNSCPVSDIKSRGISFFSSSSSSSSSSFLSRIQKEKKKKKKKKKEEEERTGNWNPFFPSLKRKKERKKVQKEKGKKINEKNTTKKIYIYIYIYIYIKRRRRRRVQRRPWTTLANTLTHRHTDTPTHWRRASQFRFIRPSFLHPFMSGCGIGPSPRQTNNKATTKQQQSNNKATTKYGPTSTNMSDAKPNRNQFENSISTRVRFWSSDPSLRFIANLPISFHQSTSSINQ